MATARCLIDRFTPAHRYAVAVRAIEATRSSLDPPFRDSSAVQLLTRCLADARSAVGGDYTGRRLSAATEQRMVAVLAGDTDADLGVVELILAVANCYAIPETGMATEQLYTVLNYCYGAVVDHEGIDDEEEHVNPSCIANIAMQQKLIGVNQSEGSE